MGSWGSKELIALKRTNAFHTKKKERDPLKAVTKWWCKPSCIVNSTHVISLFFQIGIHLNSALNNWNTPSADFPPQSIIYSTIASGEIWSNWIFLAVFTPFGLAGQLLSKEHQRANWLISKRGLYTDPSYSRSAVHWFVHLFVLLVPFYQLFHNWITHRIILFVILASDAMLIYAERGSSTGLCFRLRK